MDRFASSYQHLRAWEQTCSWAGSRNFPLTEIWMQLLQMMSAVKYRLGSLANHENLTIYRYLRALIAN